MSHRSDMTKLLKAAKKHGCEITRTGSGHWLVITPNGTRITAAFSPSTSGGVRMVRQQLAKAGVRI